MAKQVKSRFLYYGLIVTFLLLYTCVAFVSTIHSIAFFKLANIGKLALLLGIAYEIGQSSILFSILVSDNKNKLLAWLMMILLTSLQITANVYASFKFMDGSANIDWTYWQRSILFSIKDQTPETYKIIISWISGALLPIVALGMTALVSENLKLARSKSNENDEEDKMINNFNENIKEIKKKENIINKELIDNDEDLEIASLVDLQNTLDKEEKEDALLNKDKELNNISKSSTQLDIDIDKNIKEPVNKDRGWHMKKEYIDNDGNVFNKGKYSHTLISKDHNSLSPLTSTIGSPPKKV